MSQIRYFIPEDGDSENDPNVFLAPKSTRPGYPPTLGQVKSAFPLPGKYHFRFKTTLVPGYDKGPVVWMDATDNSEPVGLYQNGIIAKVTRVSFQDEDDTEDEDDFRASEMNAYQASRTKEAPRAAAPVPSRNVHAYARSAPPSINNTPIHTPHSSDADLLGHAFDSAPAASVASAGDSGSLLDGFDDRPAPPASSNPETLLDISHSASGGGDHDFFGGATSTTAPTPAPAQTTAHHHDFLGMHAPVQPQQPPRSYGNPMNSGNSMNGNGMMNGYGQQPRPQAPPQQQQQQRPQPPKKSNAFDSFSQNASPFADFGNFA